jgi:hypothetical protein
MPARPARSRPPAPPDAPPDERPRADPLPGVQQVLLSALIAEPDLQLRATISDERIAYFREQMAAGVEFPPVDAYWDGTNLWLADGFHRYLAYKRDGADALWVDVHHGSVQDALVWSYRANSSHGEPLRAPERRAALKRIEAQCRGVSARVLAKRLGVHSTTIDRLRAGRIADDRAARAQAAADRRAAQDAASAAPGAAFAAPGESAPDAPPRVVGADGKAYPEKPARGDATNGQATNGKGSAWLTPEQNAYHDTFAIAHLLDLDPATVAAAARAENLTSDAEYLRRLVLWLVRLAEALETRQRYPVQAV